MKVKLSNSDLDFMNKYAEVKTINHLKSYSFPSDFIVGSDNTVETTEKNFFDGLNGCYDEDFKSRKAIVKELIEVHGFSRDKVKILIGDIIDKMCSVEKMANGRHFWYCW